MKLIQVLWLSVILSFAGLCGCSIFGNKPARLNTKVQAVTYLNPNIYDQASPVVVVFYQLKSATAFSQANFFALYNEALKTLGTELLDKQELELRPNQSHELKQTIAPGARYLGVIAGYRNPDSAQWRQLIEIPADKKQLNLQLMLATQSITAKLS